MSIVVTTQLLILHGTLRLLGTPRQLQRPVSGVIVRKWIFCSTRSSSRLTASSAPGGGGYGQNIAAGTPSGNISAILTNGFYNGELPHYPQYGTNNPDMSDFEDWGHFSQLVWHSTTSVGCYTAICSPPGVDSLSCKPDGTSYLKGLNCGNGGIPAIFTVCNYDPPGKRAFQYNDDRHNR